MKNLVPAGIFASIIKVSSLFKISCVVGSHVLYLSGASALAPLSGAFGGVRGSFSVFFARIIIHFLFCKAIALSFLAFCIPGLFASLYWATRSSIIRVGVPLICMMLFAGHPVGGQAFIYSLYWLIPIALYVINNNSLFLEALGSTFVAHAIGSVIWLYTVPMTAAQWLALIPIVAIERVFFALCMVAVYRMVMLIKNSVQCSKNKSLSLSQGF